MMFSNFNFSASIKVAFYAFTLYSAKALLIATFGVWDLYGHLLKEPK